MDTPGFSGFRLDQKQSIVPDTTCRRTQMNECPQERALDTFQHSKTSIRDETLNHDVLPSYPTYKLYKRRFSGILGLVVLNIVSAMPWPWFGPIANDMVTEFGFTLNQVNWLGNIVTCFYLPVALIIPTIISKYGIKRCCDGAVPLILLSSWVRYAGTARSLSVTSSYALLMIGQFLASIAQPIFQIMGPIYSEAWFDLKGRTTATMIISIANPFGTALGQLLSPMVGDTRKSILFLGIISSAALPFVLLIPKAPPTPPTYAASKPSLPLSSLLRAMMGTQRSQDAYMTIQERVDFSIMVLVFGTLVAGANAFAILTAQIMQPVGYGAVTSGLLGACLLLSGIIAAIVTAPLFDRVFTHRLATVAKILVPILAGAWLSLIWAVKPHNIGGLFAIMAIVGACSITVLPVGLELGCEITRNANASSGVLWFAGNAFTLIFVLSESALRASPDANPPLNMHRALIFHGAFIISATSSVFFLRGKQARRALDEQNLQLSLSGRVTGDAK